MTTFAGTMVAALGLGALVTILIAAATSRRGKSNYRSATLVGLVVALVILVGSAAMNSFTQVEAGSVAVVKQFGRVVGVFQPGLNWKLPFIQQTIIYRTQEIVYETSENPQLSNAEYRDVQVDTATSDGQQILARYTVRFRIDGNKAAEIVKNLGTESEVVEKVVKANSRVRVRNVLKRFPASDLYSGNVEVAQEAIAEKLREDFGKEGLDLAFFGLRSIQFTEDYRNAVEQKQIEKENIATKENLAKQAEFEKQRTITQAQAEAERQKLERIGIAEGEAEAIRVKAKAQAEANKLISDSLDQNVISWQAIQNWSGSYPLVLGGGNNYILPGELFMAPTVTPTPLSVQPTAPAPAQPAEAAPTTTP